MKNMTLLSSIVTTVAVLALLSSDLNAQVLEEVIVTAQKREQSVNDIGVSVNAFSGDQLDALGIQEATDVMAFTPGATLTSSGQGIPIYTIRGIGFDDYNSNSSSTVGINIDEVALPYPIMTRVPQYDVERVEVLKGPQGTLYGQNTTGGTVNFIHNKADLDANTASAKAGVDSDAKFGIQGHINGALSDSFATRLSFFTANGGEWQENAATGGESQEHGEQDKLALRLQTTWLPTDALTVQFKADYHRDKSDNIVPQHAGTLFINPDAGPNVLAYLQEEFQAAGLPDSSDPNAASWDVNGNTFGGQNPGGDFDRDNDGLLLSLRLDWDFEAVTLTSLTSFNDYSRDEANNWDGVAVNNWDSYNKTDIEVWSQELRLTSNGDGSLKWIAGLYAAEDEVKEIATGSGTFSTPQIFVAPVDLGIDINGDGRIDVFDVQAAGAGFDLFSTQYTQESSTIGVFVHADYALSASFSVNLGVRYNEDEREIIDSCTFDVDGTLAFFFQEALFEGAVPYSQGDCVTLNPATFESEPFNKTIKSENVSGKLGIDFRPNDDLLVYANVSTGYKSGGFGAPAAAVWDSLESYDEEEVTSYEVGVKSTLAGGAVQLNAAVYTYDYQDKQVSASIIDPVFGSLTKIVNAPESTVSGAELEINWFATTNTLVRLTSAYLDTEYDEFSAFLFGQSLVATNNTPVDLSGERMQNTPEFQHNLMVHHEIGLSDSLKMFVGGDVAYSDEFNSLVGNLPAFDVDSYSVLNLKAGLANSNDKWRVTAWVNNVADEDYYTAVSPSNDSNVRVLGRERTYGVSFKYNWGE
ncbi:MAG: TonB-dependent receptor [Pseudomonadales bacterium]